MVLGHRRDEFRRGVGRERLGVVATVQFVGLVVGDDQPRVVRGPARQAKHGIDRPIDQTSQRHIEGFSGEDFDVGGERVAGGQTLLQHSADIAGHDPLVESRQRHLEVHFRKPVGGPEVGESQVAEGHACRTTERGLHGRREHVGQSLVMRSQGA